MLSLSRRFRSEELLTSTAFVRIFNLYVQKSRLQSHCFQLLATSTQHRRIPSISLLTGTTRAHTMATSSHPPRKGYIVTGRAAHERIARLFSNLLQENDHEQANQWVDLSPYANSSDENSAPNQPDSSKNGALASSEVAFLWENSARHATKSIRDSVSVYSHLPNGNVLDDKWVLARLLGSSFVSDNEASVYAVRSAQDAASNGENKELVAKCDDVHLATLESHCFRGAEFVTFANRVGLLQKNDKKTSVEFDMHAKHYKFDDLLNNSCESGADEQFLPTPPRPPTPDNLWVIKDAMSNGAGGIWILDPNNIHEYLDQDVSSDASSTDDVALSSILHPKHRYIAQRYAWPPTLYGGRKCHVRVYGCITAEGRAYVHKRAFLHVANDTFEYLGNNGTEGKFEPSVHITNCCANSHDAGKFSGEICANLTEIYFGTDNEDISLAEYFPSIAASVAALAQRSAPFLRGGEANHGFEYLGIDFVLSSVSDPVDSNKTIPVAYLLEVNAPPSQDTATGLLHAEELHDEVISDLLRMCVLPELGIAPRKCAGWVCVHRPENNLRIKEVLAVPSKAAFVNRVRWAVFEKKASKQYEMHYNKLDQIATSSKCESSPTNTFNPDAFVRFVRSEFPYFSTCRDVFLESGGGSQVPQIVMNSVMSSLSHRDRSVLGADCQKAARKALLSLLTGSADHGDNKLLFLGPNATSLLEKLARCFTTMLKEGDEIVLASENHLANILPWLALAKEVGAQVKWWTVTDMKKGSDGASEITESSVLSELITSNTKIVAISHASNILGCVREMPAICHMVHDRTASQCQVVVDGVAAAPHMLSPGVFTEKRSMQPDWYVVSLHKLFGPHLGCLVGNKSSLNSPGQSDFETGTMNYEGCAGVCALKEYFHMIANESKMTSASVAIQSVETRLVNHLLHRLQDSSSMVRIIQDLGHQQVRHNDNSHVDHALPRLPIVAFVHSNIQSCKIVEHCRRHQVICRACKFLSTDRFWKEMGIGDVGAVRFSLAHYNTLEDIDRSIEVLEMMDDWVS